MFWQDEKRAADYAVPDDVVDILFGIDCRELPVDHAHSLSTAIRRAAPWITEDARIAVHTVHVAGSQNGWERPAHGTQTRLLLSRRTKLTIRAPKQAVERLSKDLCGAALDVDGCVLKIRDAHTRLLSKQGTLQARYVVAESVDETDEAFLGRMAGELAGLGIRVRRALCGRTNLLATPAGPIATRSLMLADLAPDESVLLQLHGLGPLRQMGCGIFIPHKGIDSVRGAEDD
jgi:CRISPR-associated protein Cas6